MGAGSCNPGWMGNLLKPVGVPEGLQAAVHGEGSKVWDQVHDGESGLAGRGIFR